MNKNPFFGKSASGVLLLTAAAIAMIVANSPLSALYNALLDTTVAVQVGDLIIDKPLLLWINDGLMAIFFFLVGLEIKREVLEGELSSPERILLPAAGAVGGMLVPAGFYVALNAGDPIALEGWAIPVATDIAFALALLSVFGARVPPALKIFLLTLAIFDDLGAIVIIALFYSGDLSVVALGIAALALAVGVIMNRLGVMRSSAYVFLGIALWIAILKSGVHATLAGVLVAFCVPMRGARDESPLRSLEENLHGTVSFAILPLFAFANAGLPLANVSLSDLGNPVTLGVVIGLLLGKPVGILAAVGIVVGLKLARLPEGVDWRQVSGVSFACGIGFTMSLFIAGLAFEHRAGNYFGEDRLGILLGSLLSAVAAFLILKACLPRLASSNQ